MSYDTALLISCFLMPYALIFATLYRIYKECFVGYVLIVLFTLLVVLKAMGVFKEHWHYIYLLIICLTTLTTIGYSLYLRKKRRNKNV